MKSGFRSKKSWRSASLERSDRVYTAMQARGHTGEPRSLSHLHFRPADAAFLLVAAAYLAGCMFANPVRL